MKSYRKELWFNVPGQLLFGQTSQQPQLKTAFAEDVLAYFAGLLQK